MIYMESLPIEIIQVINDQLDFYDQINFKNICRDYRKKITIKQHIPYLLIKEEDMYNESETEYFISLDKFYLLVRKYPHIINSQDNTTYAVEIAIPGKSIMHPPIDLVGGVMYLDTTIEPLYESRVDFNMKKFIAKCFEITNKILLEDDVYK